MNNITPEHLVTVTQGATPVQIVTLVVLGVIALGVVIGIVKWAIDLKLGTLPQDLKEIQKSLVIMKQLSNDVFICFSGKWRGQEEKMYR